MPRADFARFWAAQAISGVGSQITVLALPILALNTLGVTPWELGLLNALQFAPLVLFTLVAGMLVDRHAPRPVLIWGNALAGVVLLALPALWTADLLSFWMVCVAGFLLGAFRVGIDVSVHSYPPYILSQDALVTANARLGVTYAATEVAGPGLAGLVLQLVRPAVALAADAVSYLVAAVLVSRTVVVRQHRRPARFRFADVLGGFAPAFRDPYLRAMVLLSSWFNLWGSAISTALMVYAVREARLDVRVIGLCLTVGGLGGLLGSAAAPRVGRIIGVGMTLRVSILVTLGGWFLIPWGGGAVLLCAGLAVQTFGDGLYNVFAMSLRQTVAEPERLGRINACYRLLSHGGIPLGALVAGLLMDVLSARQVLLVAACAATAGSVPLLLSRVFAVRDIESLAAARG
ncbi:MFS transporter [Actinomadura sp. ATCC 31491]|uniref:MFS transporter n=1 Tax=Actinomadura luzonensis TaxID=2805427 RepID=A0ABT0FN14_9ACTN|nr:MFS transporter [Actinomadura luzonensis]MCK2213743.1 MFS transporter [Actinomadura luzonensis]